LTNLFLILAFALSFFSTPFIAFTAFASIFFIIDLIRKKKTAKLLINDGLFFILFVALILSSVFAVFDKWLSLGSAVLFGLYWLAYFMIRNTADDKLIANVMKAVSCMLIIVCATAIAHFFINKDIVLNLFNETVIFKARSHKNTLASFMVYPALFGNFLAIHLTAMMVYFIYNFRKLKPVWIVIFALAFIIGILTIVLTQARGGLIILFVAALVVFFFLPGKVKAFLLIPVVIASVVSALFMPAKWVQTIKDPLNEANIRARFSMIVAGMDLYEEKGNPAVGIGIMGFREWWGDWPKKVKYSIYEDLNYIHNVYFSFFLETGIIGLLTFIVWIGYLIWILARDAVKKRNWKSISGFALVSGFVINSLVDNLIYVVMLGFLLFLYWGIFASEIDDRALLKS